MAAPGIQELALSTGTRPFMAPEIQGLSCQESSAYTTAVDVWSLGCLVYFMMTRALPFPETKNLVNFIKGRVRFPPSTPRTSIPPAAIQLITSMLQPLPENRPPASKAKLHSWLSITESNDTIWSQITTEPGKSTSGAELTTQMVMTSPASAQRNLFPLRPPGNRRNLGIFGRLRERGREPIQYLLGVAVASGDCKQVTEQLRKGARPMDDPSGFAPIYTAAKLGHLPVVKLLLEHGAHLGVDGDRGLSALHGAATGGSLQVVQYLLDVGAEISLRGEREGWTALPLAARHGHVENVRYLLESGDDISAQKLDSSGRNGLHLAAQYNHPEVAGLLLDWGGDLSADSKRGFKPLHTAAQFGSVDMFKLLVDKGADTSVRGGGNEGWTALLLAANGGFLDIVRYLLDERGHDISVKMLDSGESSLHLAAEEGHLDMVRLLLEKGASTASTTNSGKTAVSLATTGGHTDIVRLLTEWPEKRNVAIPFTQLDLCEPPTQEPTPASGDGSET